MPAYLTQKEAQHLATLLRYQYRHLDEFHKSNDSEKKYIYDDTIRKVKNFCSSLNFVNLTKDYSSKLDDAKKSENAKDNDRYIVKFEEELKNIVDLEAFNNETPPKELDYNTGENYWRTIVLQSNRSMPQYEKSERHVNEKYISKLMVAVKIIESSQDLYSMYASKIDKIPKLKQFAAHMELRDIYIRLYANFDRYSIQKMYFENKDIREEYHIGLVEDYQKLCGIIPMLENGELQSHAQDLKNILIYFQIQLVSKRVANGEYDFQSISKNFPHPIKEIFDTVALESDCCNKETRLDSVVRERRNTVGTLDKVTKEYRKATLNNERRKSQSRRSTTTTQKTAATEPLVSAESCSRPKQTKTPFETTSQKSSTKHGHTTTERRSTSLTRVPQSKKSIRHRSHRPKKPPQNNIQPSSETSSLRP